MVGQYWQVKGIVPPTIKCSGCYEDKDSKKHFSNVTLNKYRAFVRELQQTSNAPGKKIAKSDKAVYVLCKKCTPVQRQDLTCCVCHKTKGLNWFARAQRRNPDEAKCLECMRATQLVLPTSADYAEDEEGDEDDIEGPRKRVRGDPNYFVMDDAGQYYTTFNDAESSVSNPWASRAASVVSSHGVSSTISKSRASDKDESTSPSGAASSSSNDRNRPTNRHLTTLNLDTLKEIVGTFDLHRNTRGNASVNSWNDSNGNESDGSVMTVRGKGKSVVKSRDDPMLPNSATKETSHPGIKKKLSFDSLYDNSSSEEEDDAYSRISKPTITHGLNIYGGNNWHTSNTRSVTTASNSGLMDDKRPGFQSMQSHEGSTSLGPINMRLGDDDLDVTPIDYQSAARDARVSASGFKSNKNQDKRFPRIRPNNMLSSDLEKGLLFRKNDDPSRKTKAPKLPDEVDSDDEW